MADRLVPLDGGRRIGVQAFGDPAASRIVLLCHPAPGSATIDPDPVITGDWAVHLIAVERPGYGSSDPLPDDAPSRIVDRADDLATYLDQVRLEAESSGHRAPREVGVVGWSAGGRVALALAARHPELVDSVAIVGTPAPNAEVEWVPKAAAKANARLARLAPAEARSQLRRLLEPQVPTSDEPDPALVGASAADEPALARPGALHRVQRMLVAAYRQGAVGVADDVLSYATDDWGFDLGAVLAPVLLVYGASDPAVPSAHGRWYRKQLQHATLSVEPAAGHLAIIPAWRRVLEHVAPERGEPGRRG